MPRSLKEEKQKPIYVEKTKYDKYVYIAGATSKLFLTEISLSLSRLTVHKVSAYSIVYMIRSMKRYEVSKVDSVYKKAFQQRNQIKHKGSGRCL